MKLTKKTNPTEAALARRRAKMARNYRTLLSRCDAMDAVVAAHETQSAEVVWDTVPV